MKTKMKMKMKNNKIHWKKALELLRNDISISEYEVYFDDEKVGISDDILFMKNNINVPKHLTEYDDDDIDYSDIPATTEEEFRGRWFNITELFPIDCNEAIKMLKNGEDISIYHVYFDNEKIEFSDAELLRKNNIKVPENLIIYETGKN